MTTASKTKSFLKRTKEKVIVFDGAMGTSLFSYDLTAEDYGGAAFDGCPEHLNYTKPEIVQKIHSKFFEAGADIVETNTFGASKHVLAEYELENLSYDISLKATQLAREVADKFTEQDPSNPRYVAGSIGPGTKLVSLGNISFDELRASYHDQIRGMIDAGADILLFETCQDTLQIKAALLSAFDVFQEIEAECKDLSDEELLAKYPRLVLYSQDTRFKPRAGISQRLRLPIHVQVTVETMGTLLVGSDIASALTTISAYPVDTVGMNCATGPKEMQEHIQYLADNSTQMISCLPNAGIPENIGGVAHFPLGPDEFSDALAKFTEQYDINVVGGCCGTTYEHIRKLSEKLQGKKSQRGQNPSKNEECIESVSSLYSSVPMLMEPKPLIVGERTNANGSRLFKNLLGESDYEGIVDIAKGQVEEGAHVLDVCTAYVGRDETKDMVEVISRINTQVNIPIMVDSTEFEVLEESLKYISGKAIINSVNLEDGEERVAKIAALANQFGAALVVLTIDEDGMAKTFEHKVKVAERLYDLLVNKHGVDARNLIYDTLTFTLGAGEEEMRSAGIETISAIREIKTRHPEVKTILGLSNISFGLDAKLRVPLNSVFQYECVQAGLDMSICNSKKILPLSKIDDKVRKLCLDLIYDKREFSDEARTNCSYDPLMDLLACLEDIQEVASENKNPYEGMEVEQILAQRIIDGNKTDIAQDLNAAMSKGHAALDIINGFLMDGMKVVGERFGAGEMQLPFVLQSATTMKTAVSHLEQFMEKEEGEGERFKGSIVLATVKGDVHDIGKNLVDIILSNNGYKVYNLGVKQPIEEIIKALDEHKPDVIGLSGLLVKSTLIMKQNMEYLSERGYDIPVILGGAALTRRFVEEDCNNAYRGTVFYGFDAFTDLDLMEKICAGEDCEKLKEVFYKTKPRNYAGPEMDRVISEAEAEIQALTDSAKGEGPYDDVEDLKAQAANFSYTSKLSETQTLDKIPGLPFYGDRIVETKDINLDDVWKFLNIDALVIGQWRMGKGSKSKEEYQKQLKNEIYPTLERIKNIVRSEGYMQPSFAYGYYPCKVSADNPNKLDIYNEARDQVVESFVFPRQMKNDHLCLSDYFRMDGDGFNIVPLQVVTIGQSTKEYIDKLYASGDFGEYLYHYGLATETTEALAEYAHAQIRRELGFGTEDHADYAKLIKCSYHGMRYSFGYPACPRIEDQKQVFNLLKPERLGMELSEEWQIHPEHSTSAIVVHHPMAKYFNI